MTVVELATGRIEMLVSDPDRMYSHEWVEQDGVTADPRQAPNVVLSTWFDEQDEEPMPGLYRAVFHDGRRSDEVRFPNARRRAA